MCGIFGYIGFRNPMTTAISGLKRLEYRGYDSAGIASIEQEGIVYCKEVGKVSQLEEAASKREWRGKAAIAQTRWATHGKVSQVNAHPHFDEKKTVAIVHNGIIENYDRIKAELKERGVRFASDTDSEVIAHLISLHYKGDFLLAVQQTVAELQGSYAVVAIHRDHPDQLIAFASEAPLVIGIGNKEAFVTSDPMAFSSYTKRAVYLHGGEIAVIKAESQEIYAAEELIDKESVLLEHENIDSSKGEFAHFTLKEIFEQPQTLRSAFLSRFHMEYGTAIFEELAMQESDLLGIEQIVILACGTSWHAGFVGKYLLEEMARIPVQLEISSEFRYKNPIIPPHTFVIAISQSGETADTIAAVREVKAKGVKVLALCNVHGSTLEREADETIFLKAGPEIGVCSTKAFTSQVAILSLFTLLMARMRHMSKALGKQFLEELMQLPDQVQAVLETAPLIEKIALQYAKYDDFFYIGRRCMYPTSLEGALKLKEISYINANGYPAGEIKHGPIALINEECPTVALCGDSATYEKLLSNLMEIKARKGKIIAIASKKDERLSAVADDIIYVPDTSDACAIIPISVANQLLAYYIARARGAEIDHPRNLAKAVTVE